MVLSMASDVPDDYSQPRNASGVGDDYSDAGVRHEGQVAGAGQSPGAEDGRLVRLTLCGDLKAYDRLVEKYQRQAAAVSYRLLGNHADAAEITQDAFLKTYASLAELQKPEAFVGWLMRTVSNLSLNKRRGRSLRKAASLEEQMGAGSGNDHSTDSGGEGLHGGETDPARTAMGKELGEQLKRAMNDLPEKQRQVLTMFSIDGRSQKDIASELGCSVEAVKWHVFQARKKLKDMLKEYL